MNVALGSCFRNSVGYLDTYIGQVNRLRKLLEERGDTLRVIAIENDSTDNTFLQLDDWGANIFVDLTLIGAHDDCPYFPSVDLPQRWTHMAWLQNLVLEELDDRDDVFVYVESDLRWLPTEMVRLIDHLQSLDAVSCPNWATQRETRYYDTWGSRKDGLRFEPYEPYHPAWDGELMRMDSVASVLALRADIARKTRAKPNTGFVGWCHDITSQGYEIWLDPKLAVIHP